MLGCEGYIEDMDPNPFLMNSSLHTGDAVEVHTKDASRSITGRASVLVFKWMGDLWQSEYIEVRTLGVVVSPEALNFAVFDDPEGDVTVYVPKLGCTCIINEKFLRVIA
jgi:hypothetical protein